LSVLAYVYGFLMIAGILAGFAAAVAFHRAHPETDPANLPKGFDPRAAWATFKAEFHKSFFGIEDHMALQRLAVHP
jgi:hypothetical protein